MDLKSLSAVVLNMFQKHGGWSSFSASGGNYKYENQLNYQFSLSLQTCTVFFQYHVLKSGHTLNSCVYKKYQPVISLQFHILFSFLSFYFQSFVIVVIMNSFPSVKLDIFHRILLVHSHTVVFLFQMLSCCPRLLLLHCIIILLKSLGCVYSGQFPLNMR